MSPIAYRMNDLLSRVVQRVPVGTNLGLFHGLWMLLSGRLLLSRGAVIPGLAAEAVRRAWAALAYGQWHAAQLREAWAQRVREEKIIMGWQTDTMRNMQQLSLLRWEWAIFLQQIFEKHLPERQYR